MGSEPSEALGTAIGWRKKRLHEAAHCLSPGGSALARSTEGARRKWEDHLGATSPREYAATLADLKEMRGRMVAGAMPSSIVAER